MVEVGTRGLGEVGDWVRWVTGGLGGWVRWGTGGTIGYLRSISSSPRQNLSVASFFRFHVITVPIVEKAIESTCPN